MAPSVPPLQLPPTQEDLDGIAAQSVLSVIDGGYTDNTGIGHAVAAGANEVVAWLDTISSLWALFGGYPRVEPLFNTTVMPDTCPLCFNNYQVFEDDWKDVAQRFTTTAWNLTHAPETTDPMASTYVGTITATTHENPWMGIKGGKTVTLHIVAVDAPTLSTLCPVLSRALKEKLAIHKRAACIVINNMSKLVGSPDDVAPFGPLLVPELKKVAESVQFEEIRDEALKALASLTRALGDSYKEGGDEEAADEAAKLAEENAAIEAEQKRIKDERDAEKAKEEALKKKEEEEKRKYKEAMDAQRELNKLAEEKARKESGGREREEGEGAPRIRCERGRAKACGVFQKAKGAVS